MLSLQAFKDQKIAVVGLGESGLPVCRALEKAGSFVFAWDDGREARERASQENFLLKAPEDMPWNEIHLLVLSPGIPHLFPIPHPAATLARHNKVPIICDIELFVHSNEDVPVIGITGTNGKSTTTALMGHLLNTSGRRAEVGGNIGRSVMEFQPLSSKDYYVLELSSYQLERTSSLHCEYAALLNIGADHLSRHGGMEGYAQAKKMIFLSKTSQTAFVSVDDPFSQAIYEEVSKNPLKKVIPFSLRKPLEKGLFVQQGYLYDPVWEKNTAPLLDLRNAPYLQGTHNHQNMLAAYGLSRALGLSLKEIQRGFETFQGLAHRMEILYQSPRLLVINDSKATNAEAAARALDTFDHIHWILGGIPKETGLQGLEVYYSKIKHAYLIGAASETFAQALEGKVSYSLCRTLEKAVQKAFDNISSSKRNVILLSPACASFDQFKNYEQRGNIFRDLIRATLSSFSDVSGQKEKPSS